MTWVLGAHLKYGGIVMASDIRITLGAREIDCLQKIYMVGSNVIAGFAGSVAIGLETMEFISKQLALPEPGRPWELAAIASTWLPRVIRFRFKQYDAKYRDLGASFLIGSVSTGRRVNLLFPESRLYVLRSANDFRPEEVPVDSTGSIGNGSGLEGPIREFIVRDDFRKTIDADIRIRSFVVAEQLRNCVLKSPTRGVSPMFMMGWSEYGRQGIEPWTTRGEEAAVAPDQKVRLARSLAELKSYWGAAALEAVG